MLYTIKETADVLKTSERTVQRMIASGKLPKVVVGERLVRIPVESVGKLVEASEPKMSAAQDSFRRRMT